MQRLPRSTVAGSVPGRAAIAPPLQGLVKDPGLARRLADAPCGCYYCVFRGRPRLPELNPERPASTAGPDIRAVPAGAAAGMGD